MKTNNINRFNTIIALVSIAFACLGFKMHAQAPQGEKMRASIQLTVTNKADHNIYASVFIVATGSGQKKRMPAKSAKVNFYTESQGAEKLIQSAVTGANGRAEVLLPNNLPIDTGNNYYVTAKIENDPLYENTDENVHFKTAKLTLNLVQKDTMRTAIATLTEKGKDGKEIPIKDAEIGFYVQRLFGTMPVAEDYKSNTDDSGKAVFTFPKAITIPGNVKGDMDIVVKLSDNEKYGNIEAKSPSGWGVPVPVETNPFPRVLWASSAPPALVITICILFGGIWSIFIFMLIQLRKISTEEIE